VNKKWMPIAVGIFDLISGVYLLLLTSIVSSMIAYAYVGNVYVTPFLFAMLIVPGILAIVASVYALKRKKWGLVLAVTITVLLLPLPVLIPIAYYGGIIPLLNTPLAIAAVVLIALSKKQFERK